MEFDELRSRLAVILAVEERVPTDWLEVERQPPGPDAEAILHPRDHALARGHLGLAHRGARFHVHDDGVVEIDEVVGRIVGCAVLSSAWSPLQAHERMNAGWAAMSCRVTA